MNKYKIIHVFIGLSLSIPAHAQEVGRIAEKPPVSQLIRENKALTRSILENKIALEHEAHMFAKPDQYGQLTDILNAYQSFIDQNGSLPEDKRRALDQIVDASAEVGHIREREVAPANIVINDAGIQNELDQNQRILNDQAMLLQQKNQQLKAYERQLSRLSSQKGDHKLNKAYQEKSKEVEALKSKLAAFQNQLARNNQHYKNAAVNKALASTHVPERSIDQMQAEKESLLKDKEDLLQKKSAQSQLLQDELTRIKEALSKTNDRYETALKDYRNSTKDLKVDAAASSRMAREIVEKTAKISDLTASNAELAKTLKSFKDNNARLAELEKKLSEKDEQISLLKTELANALQQNALMHKQLDEEDADLRQIRDKAEAFRKKYQEQVDIVAVKEREIKKLNDQLAHIPKQEHVQDPNISALKDQLAKAEAQAHDAKAELMKTAQALVANKEEITAKDRRLAELEERIAGMQRNDQRALDIVNKETAVSKKTERKVIVSEDKEEVITLKEEAKQLRAQLADLHKSVKKDPKDQSALIAQKEQEIKALNEKLAQILKNKHQRADVGTLQNDLAKAQDEEWRAKQALQRMAKDLVANQEELSIKSRRLAELEATIAKLEKPGAAPVMKEVVSVPAVVEVKGSKDDELAALKEQAKQLRAALNALRDEQMPAQGGDKVIAELRAKIRKDDEIFAHLKDRGLALKEKISSLNNDVALKDAQIAALKLSLKQAGASVVQTPAEIQGNNTNAAEMAVKASLTPLQREEYDRLKKQYEIVVMNPVRTTGKKNDPEIDELKRHYQIVVKSPEEIAGIVKENSDPSSDTPKSQGGLTAKEMAQLDALKAQAQIFRDQLTELKARQMGSGDQEKYRDALVKQLAAAQKEAKEMRDQVAFLKMAHTNDSVQQQPQKGITIQPVVVKADTKALDDQIAAAKQESKDLKDQLEQSHKLSRALSIEIVKNQEAVNLQKNQTDERRALQEMLQAKQRQRIEMLMVKNKLIVEHQNKVLGNLEEYKQKLNGAKNDWAAQQQEYEKRMAELKFAVDTMNMNNTKLSEELKAAKKEKEEAYQITDRFKDRLKETSDVNENQSKELAQARQRADALEVNLRKINEDMTGKENVLIKAQDELLRTKTERSQALKDVQIKDLSLSMAQSTMQAKTKVLQTLADQLKDQIKISDAQLAAVRKQLKETQEELVEANRRADAERLKEMLKSSREEMLQINNLLKNKEQQIVSLQKSLEDNAIDFTAQQKAIDAIKADMDKEQKTIARLNEEIGWKNKEIARLKAQLKEKKINLLPASLSGVDLVIARDRQQIADLTAKLNAANDRINAAAIPKSVDPQGLRKALDDAREQIATLKEKLRQKREGLVQNDPSVIAMNKEIKTLNSSLMDVMKENGDLKDKNESLFDQINELRAELTKCQDQIKALPSAQ